MLESLPALGLGAVVGAILAWLWLRSRHLATIAALRAERDTERRFAEERRAQAERTDTVLAQLATLGDTHRDLSSQTQHLLDTMRSPVVRGQWGELQLRRVCELAQMTEHVDFVVQETVWSGEGRLRPDLTVLMPGGRSVVIDAKAPMAAWLEAMEAPDEAARVDALRRHARHVKDHITRLAARGYWEQFAESPEFVVLFLPGEALFSAALQYDAGLVEHGVERGVILASPTTLIALLRVVGLGWARQRIARDADEIRELGVELHGRLETWAGHVNDVRRGLEKAIDAYNRSVGSLEHRVLPQARRFGWLSGAGDGATPELRPLVASWREAEPPPTP
ncbi:MAG: DNA recombination protein RmuC [Gemmatimonadaceae bacterium]|nr:DNA recombination protein RmuC [Gemmatimonadaceae bacterium]